jgi:hypothetical protein
MADIMKFLPFGIVNHLPPESQPRSGYEFIRRV